MAQRTLARLKKQKMVLDRRISTGGCMYVISTGGAYYLREQGYDHVSVRGHRDLSFDKPRHRMIANDYAIDCYLGGQRVWTEFEVSRGLAPVPEIYIKTYTRTGSIKRRKYPDVVTEFDGHLSWVEVENAPKPKARLAQLMSLAEHLLNSTAGYEVTLDNDAAWYDEFLFITPNKRNFLSVARAIKHANLSYDALNRLAILAGKMSSGGIWHGITGRVDALDVIQLHDI